MNRILKLIFLLLAQIYSSICYSQVISSYPRARISANQYLFSGDKYKSFSESQSATGASIKIQSGGAHFAPVFGFNLLALNGRQDFYDGSTNVVTSIFNYYSASTDIGLQYFILERSKKGMNIFLSGAGVLGYNLISLSKNTTLTTIPYNDKSFSYGYAAGIGAEFIFSTAPNYKWSLYLDVQMREESTQLLEQNFDLGGLMISLGLGW